MVLQYAGFVMPANYPATSCIGIVIERTAHLHFKGQVVQRGNHGACKNRQIVKCSNHIVVAELRSNGVLTFCPMQAWLVCTLQNARLQLFAQTARW